VGGASANSLPVELGGLPPTPDPSPPRARARGRRGVNCAHLRDLAARCTRALPRFLDPPTRGRRECRAPDAPDSRVCNGSERRTRVGQVTPEITRHSPRNGFNGFLRALLGDRAFLPPSSLDLSSTNLTPASGRQDHTTSPSASGAVVTSAIGVHRIPPRVDDVAQRPSWRDGTADDIALICVSEKQKYFCKRGWTGFGDLPCRANHAWETGCILVEFEICGAVYGPFPA